MKQQLKNLVATALFGLWACSANAHHAAGQVVCTDVNPPRPVSGVVVTIKADSGTTYTATTDADGAYGVNLPVITETYTITIATPAGLVLTAPAGGKYVSTIFADGLGGPNSIDGANFGLLGCVTPLAQIGDLVFNDTNANGVQDAGETGVNGVTVELFRCLDNASMGSTITAGGGLYGFTVAPGSYYVKFSNLPAGYVFSPSTASTASDATDSDANAAGVTDCTELTAGENDPTWDAGIYQPGRIGDLVFNDTNGNGQQDGGESGVNGVTVELFRCADNTLVATTITSGGGIYGFTVVPGSYYVKFSNLPVGYVFSPSTPSTASDATDSDANAAGVTSCTDVTGGENDTTWDAGIYQPARIGDLVFLDTNANGVQDAGETGVNGVTVELFRCLDNASMGTTTTAGGGLYGFTVAPGSYYVKFSNLPVGYVFSPSTASTASDATDSDANAAGVTDCTELTAGENDPTWDAGIYQPARIGDLVFNDSNANGVQDAGETGVNGVTVELFRCLDNASMGTTITAGGGLYGFTVAPGSYYVKFSNLPAGYVFSPSTPSTVSDATDSDANAAGVTSCTELTSGENDSTWDAGIYQQTARIGDFVFNDTNTNGVQDAGELGVDGVRVELYRCSDSVLVGATTTAGGGLYSFEIAPGSYFVRFSNLPAGFTFSPSIAGAASDPNDSDANAAGVTDCTELSGGENDTTWDAGIYRRTARIGDFVFNDTNANGVQDAGETGVDGVRVELFRCSDNGLVGTAITVNGGGYRFDVAPGRYYVRFSNLPSGYVFSPSTPGSASDPTDSDADPLTGRTDCVDLAPGQFDSTWDAGIYRPAQIGDFVFYDTNGNGVQDAGETGVVGVKVELFRCSDNALVGTSVTIAGGVYGFETVPGRYYVKFSNLPAGYVFSPSTPGLASDPTDSDANPSGVTDCTELTAGENDITWDAGIYQPARIGDLVFNDTNANGVQDAGETGVNGVTVELFRCSDNGLVATTTTSGGGIYGFNVAAGSYYVKFSNLPAGYVFSPSTASTVSDPTDSDANASGVTSCTELTAGETDVTWDAGIYQPARIGDLVFNDTNANGVQDAGETGVNGVTVELFRCSDNVLMGTTTTSGGGIYGFSVAPGSYYVKFSNLPAGYVFSPSTASTVSDPTDSDANASGVTSCTELTVGENDTTWDAGIYQPAKIGDLVFNDTNANGVQDAGEAGVNGVKVELFRCSDNTLVGTTTSSGGGIYGFTVAPGSYYVKFSNLPAGYVFSPSTASTASDPTDSDANAAGVTSCTELTAGENDITWDAGIYQPAKIGDLVFNDTNANGVQDAGEAGVNGVTVELFRCSDNTLVATTATSGGGIYAFTVAPGSYYVKFSNLPAGYVFSPSTASTASDPTDSDANAAGVTSCTELTAGENDITWDAGIYQPAKIGDLVFNDTNANGVQDAGETGVNGVTVELFRCADNSLVGTTTTSGGGIYGFTVAPGSYYVKFSNLPAGYVFSPSTASTASDATDSDANAAGVTDCTALTAGENDVTWDAGIYQPAKIGDFVFNDANTNGVQDAGEVGVNGVKVELFRCSDNGLVATTTTSGGGIYGFTVAPGSYYVKFSTLPAGFVFSPSTAGTASDPNDSDANPATGRTDCTTLVSGENDVTWDAGIYQPPVPVCVPVAIATTGATATSGTAGNIRTFSAGGVTVKASAFSRLKATATWATAYLGAYSSGLGVTDGSEGDGSLDRHVVDNIDRNNYVLFEFSEPVVLNRVFLGYVASDSDLSIWIGTFNNPIANHLTLSDAVLGQFGYTEGNEALDGLTRWADVNAGEVVGNVVVIAADITDTTPEDQFKIQTLDLCRRTVPILATIGDKVWNDTNANGIQDAGEAGVDGVKVELFRCADAGLVNTTNTSGGGLYSFKVAPGSYYVKFSNLPAGYRFSPSTAGTASDTNDSDANAATGVTDCTELTSGENDPSWDAGIYKPATIGDLVFNDANANGRQDAGEAGVDGVKVELFRCSDNALVATTTSSGGGRYGFTVAPGDYYVKFSNLPAGYVFSPSTPSTTSDASDSDVNPATGRTDCTNLAAGENDTTWDAGIYSPATCVPVAIATTGATTTSGTAGNVRTFTAGGVSVKASAFSRVKLTGAWAPAYLGAYSTGLGVTDSSEGDGSLDRHVVDNLDRDNYVLFEFSEPVVLNRLFLGYVVADSDLNVWIGTFADPFNAHLTLSDSVMGRFAFTEENLSANNLTRWADVNAGQVVGNVVVVAASLSDLTPDDQFKIQTLDICRQVAPAVATIGDKVWHDANANGVQDAGEAGVDGVKVELFRCGTNTLVASALTSGGGRYSFTVAAGDYYVRFSGLPVGYVFSPSTASTASDANDSDANPATGKTDCITLAAGENDPTWDAGIYVPATCEPVTITTIGSSATSGSMGNIRTFTANGVTVKASAFSRVKATGAWAPAYLGAYNVGLGVTDSSEADGSNNRHLLDNVDRDNFIMFEFSEPVVLNRAFLGYVISDSDLNLWIGTFNDPLNNHLNLSDATLSRFGYTEENLGADGSTRWADLNAGNVIGNVVVFSAWLGDTTPEDQFKIQALDICRAGWVNPAGTDTTPEPFLYMAAPRLGADGLFQAEVTAMGVTSYVIESSSNLIHWTPVVTGTTESLQFVDPVPPNGERRFYRLRAQQ